MYKDLNNVQWDSYMVKKILGKHLIQVKGSVEDPNVFLVIELIGINFKTTMSLPVINQPICCKSFIILT